MKHKVLAVLFSIAVGGLPPAGSAVGSSDCANAVEQEAFDTAFNLCKPLAQQGDAVGQYNLGWMYLSGQGVARDMAEALKWISRAAGRIIRRCLAKEPDRRYETALGLRNELEDLKNEIDSNDRRDAPARHPAKSRHWAFLGIVAVIGIVAIFALKYWSPDV